MSSGAEHNYSLSEITKYLQTTLIVLVILYFGKALLVPLFFGLLIAILTYPASNWLESKNISRTLAVTILITIIIFVFGILVWLLGYELNFFLSDLPLVIKRLSIFTTEISKWIEATFGLQQSQQNSLLERLMNNFEKSINSNFSNALSTTFSTLLMLVLVPIYGALFLYHRGTFVKFLESIAGPKHKDKLTIILNQSIYTYYKFIRGTFFVYCIVGVLNSIGLLLLGIKHAILFGMVTAFMTAVPYVGIIISAALPVSMALVTKDSVWYAFGVIAVFCIVQYLEANVIFPRVVGQQLNLSTWAVLVAIILGTILWGVAGMILFIPFAAILKIISDNIEEWKPLNILLNRENGFKK